MSAAVLATLMLLVAGVDSGEAKIRKKPTTNTNTFDNSELMQWGKTSKNMKASSKKGSQGSDLPRKR